MMSPNNGSAVKLKEGEAEAKRAKGVFPRLSMSKALELLETIYRLGDGEQVRRRRVFDEMKRSPDSGASRALIIAANSGYDLITGSYNSEYLGIDEVGKRIVTANSEADKLRAIFQSLFSNDIFTGFVSYFNDRPLPREEVAIDHLVKNYGLSQPDAKACWEIFKANIIDFGLAEELSGKTVVVSQQTALQHKSGLSSDLEIPPDVDNIDTNRPPLEGGVISKALVTPQMPTEMIPQFTFNIQIVLPESASPETYDHIFKSISTHLLRRGG